MRQYARSAMKDPMFRQKMLENKPKLALRIQVPRYGLGTLLKNGSGQLGKFRQAWQCHQMQFCRQTVHKDSLAPKAEFEPDTAAQLAPHTPVQRQNEEASQGSLSPTEPWSPNYLPDDFSRLPRTQVATSSEDLDDLLDDLVANPGNYEAMTKGKGKSGKHAFQYWIKCNQCQIHIDKTNYFMQTCGHRVHENLHSETPQ